MFASFSRPACLAPWRGPCTGPFSCPARSQGTP